MDFSKENIQYFKIFQQLRKILLQEKSYKLNYKNSLNDKNLLFINKYLLQIKQEIKFHSKKYSNFNFNGENKI